MGKRPDLRPAQAKKGQHDRGQQQKGQDKAQRQRLELDQVFHRE
jgi:hypothetical protein